MKKGWGDGKEEQNRANEKEKESEKGKKEREGLSRAARACVPFFIYCGAASFIRFFLSVSVTAISSILAPLLSSLLAHSSISRVDCTADHLY